MNTWSDAWSGIFSDGQSAAAHEVRVQLSFDGLTFYTDDKSLRHKWPYDKLTSIQPLNIAKPSQIGFSDTPGARLYLGDVAFTAKLLEHAPQLSRKAERRRILYPMLGATALIIAVIAILIFTEVSIARVLAFMIPDGVRKEMGKGVIASLSSGKPQCTNPAGLAAFDKMVTRLNQGVSQKQSYSVSVAKLGYVNAFAAPGEQIVISGDLIEFAQSPEEVAGVIAHEMGHGLERHPETGVVRSIGFAAAVALLTGGNSTTVADFGSLMLQMKYIRDAEREADQHALQILEKTAIAGKPMAEFFRRMEEKFNPLLKNKTDNTSAEEKDKKSPDPQSGSSSGSTSSGKTDDEPSVIETVFSTHPATPERIKLIEGKKTWPSTPLLTSEEWQALQKICQ